MDKKLEQWQEENKLLGEYCGLQFVGIDEDEEVSFLGNKEQFSDYNNMKDREIFYDRDNRPYLINEDEESSITYLD